MAEETGAEGQQFFYVQHCPLDLECSQQSWRKARVWGWTEDECRARLLHHLICSSHHAGHNEEEVEAIVETTTLIEDFDDEVVRPEPKRQRASNSSQAASSLAASSRATSSSRLPPADDGDVTLSRKKLNAALDSVGRAYNAARHSQKLASAASEAFASEAEVLLEARSALEALKR